MPKLSSQILLLMAGLLCASATTFLIPHDDRLAFLEENGFIENLTLCGYILCIYLMVQKGGTDWVKAQWRLLVIVLLLLAREADFHAKYTESSIFGTKYFFSSTESILSLIVVGFIVLFVCWVFGSTAWKYARWFFQRLGSFSPDALFIAIAILLAIIAKFIDGATRKLTQYQVALNQNSELLALLVEETLELGIPLALCLSVLNHFSDLSARSVPMTSKAMD